MAEFSRAYAVLSAFSISHLRALLSASAAGAAPEHVYSAVPQGPVQHRFPAVLSTHKDLIQALFIPSQTCHPGIHVAVFYNHYILRSNSSESRFART